ncbi:hypothetical protein [Micromonospora aurantiaca]|uniref:hypothetical protein n=1 Tax=Micromonospora aurantiaca (nom. illeg.) TaxID=47850 RepID=UPI001F0CBE34|nr:hypothetical protein [Micromonospora aurantiaca]
MSGVVPVPRPPAGARRIGSEDDARMLASWLQDPARDRPVVLLTVAAGHPVPFADADAIVEAVGGLATVVVLPTSRLSWAFSAAMPAGTQVYGGAARVYPAGDVWQADPRVARLRFAYSPADRDKVTDRLVRDVFQAVTGDKPPALGATRPEHGVVQALIGSRALVRLDNGELASVWEELTVPGVPLDRVLVAMQEVSGGYDPVSRRLDLRTALQHDDPQAAHARLAAAYRTADIALADVTAVDADSVTLRPLPGITVTVSRAEVTANPDDLLHDLFTVGEVVTARIAFTKSGELSLDLNLAGDEQPATAPSLLPGGPAWLTPPDIRPPVPPNPCGPSAASAAAAAVPAATPAASVPHPRDATPALLAHRPPTHPALAAERALREALEQDLDALRGHTADLGADLARAQLRIQDLQTRYRRADLARQQAQRQLRAERRDQPESDQPLFADPDQQFRHDVYIEWARRVPAAEKPHRPLADYHLGTEFLASLEAIEGVTRAKVIAVIVEVLTGQVHHLPARDAHQLRTGSAGSPYVIRADGATCWRVALQRNAPAARRLHYWRKGDTYELSRVVVHDDVRP